MHFICDTFRPSYSSRAAIAAQHSANLKPRARIDPRKGNGTCRARSSPKSLKTGATGVELTEATEGKNVPGILRPCVWRFKTSGEVSSFCAPFLFAVDGPPRGGWPSP